jgi:hypothetical protein
MKKFLLLLITTIALLFTACLDEQEAEQQEDAVAEIEATFSDAATGEPLSNFDVFLIIEVEEFDQPVDIAPFETDATGFLSTPIFGPSEDTITTIIFEYEVAGEIRSVQEDDVDLQLRFQEPVNSVSLDFEVDLPQN